MDPFMMDFADDAAGKVRPLNGLMLGGRGLLGLAALPVLQALKEADYPMDVVVGTGGGALVAALVGLGLPPRKIKTMLADLQAEPLIAKTPDLETPPTRLAKLTHGQFGKIEPKIAGHEIPANARLSSVFEKVLGRKKLEKLGSTVILEACPQGTRRPLRLEKGSLKDCVMAAMADGHIVEPIDLDGRCFVDASPKGRSPCRLACAWAHVAWSDLPENRPDHLWCRAGSLSGSRAYAGRRTCRPVIAAGDQPVGSRSYRRDNRRGRACPG